MRFFTHSYVTLIVLLLLGMVPKQVDAQQILAAIVTADLPRYRLAHDAMTTVLKAGGFGEDKLKVFTQIPNADKMSLANSLRRAQSAGATLVVTFGSRATAAAQKELKDVPLLFADVYDPVVQGAVKTLSAPGTDATGATSKTDLSRLVDAVVGFKTLKKVGVLYTKGEPGAELQLAEIQAMAKKNGFTVVAEHVRNAKEAGSQATKLAKSCDALFLTESIPVALGSETILSAATGAGCLVFSQIPGLVKAGATIGLEASPDEQGKLVAVHALQLLQGQKAHLLPVRSGKKIVLKINRKAIEKLGITIPAELAATAEMVD